ncbi:catalase [Epithele typhae]|uniref:catalase n=1 Tax=Epithele typhae TaxID=378194 RepID=UPI0020073AA9|nr:catalase [Epithele typhae]KAH9919457.1 catalase [Epithele typhae]
MPSQAVFSTKDNATYTTSSGAPVAHPYAAQRVGKIGPLLLQDFHHIDLLAHFDRERIPERVVHAKGAGAHGFFEVTHDVKDLSCAALFNTIGKKSPLTIRFSTVGGESGSADSARDPRGFAIKIKTEEGNLDWVFNNTPVFFIRDPAKFPHFIHTQKRDPQTHLKDADMFWSIHQVMILFSDRGTPVGYHHMHGYSGHTFKWVNEKGQFHYTQVHIRKDGGCKTYTDQEAGKMSGENPDVGIQLLFEDIEKGDFPSWTVYVQTMTPEQAEKFRYNILDLTKIWPHSEFPLRPVGKIVLNKNTDNYFAEIEQAAFSPSHLVPGIEPSADPLPINAPVAPVANFQRDGAMAFNSQGARPNYQSSIVPLAYKPKVYESVDHEIFLGSAQADLSEITELDFEQPRALWTKVFNDTDREHLVYNFSVHLGNAKSAEVKARQLAVFAAVSQDLSDRVAEKIGAPKVAPLKVKSAAEAIRFKCRAA